MPIMDYPSLGKEFDDDVVICYSKRTALTKSGKKGKGFKDTFSEVMLEGLFKDLLKSLDGLNPKDIGDIIVGNVL